MKAGVPVIRLYSRDHKYLEIFPKVFGGEVRRWANKVSVYQRYRQDAVQLVKEIRPYLILNTKIADEVLLWQGRPYRVGASKKVPCPMNCGRMMRRDANSCYACYVGTLRASRAEKPIKPVSTAVLSRSGAGEISPTATGRIHRLRG
jgi:hypothetical protein